MNRSNTVKAGGLVFLLGLVVLAASLFSTADNLASSYPARDIVWVLPGAVAIAGLCFVIGAGLVEYRPWARVLGAIISLILLPSFLWIGIIGALALYYLVRGWREQPVSGRAIGNKTVASTRK